MGYFLVLVEIRNQFQNPGGGKRKSMMLGMAKVVFSILLSGMMAIGRAMESGRRGYGSSSGWKVIVDELDGVPRPVGL
ncbi:hypothetical protein TNCV_3160611 [Trichonephila clavipes]|nr:hypothetical protein TNCV_3160611 [Trichonephila clavipes]